MNTQVPFEELITRLQDYISQTKNCVVSTLGEKLFDKPQAQNSKVAPTFSPEQIKQMQDIVNFVEKND